MKALTNAAVHYEAAMLSKFVHGTFRTRYSQQMAEISKIGWWPLVRYATEQRRQCGVYKFQKLWLGCRLHLTSLGATNGSWIRDANLTKLHDCSPKPLVSPSRQTWTTIVTALKSQTSRPIFPLPVHDATHGTTPFLVGHRPPIRFSRC